MSAAAIVEILIRDSHCPDAKGLIEASVHRPARGKRWIASFRNQAGRQEWKSTGLTDKNAAIILAKEWEAAARRQRGSARQTPRKALIRVAGGSGKGDTGLFTQREVALLMKISERAVRNIERRAIAKLQSNPVLKALWRDWNLGEIEEGFMPASNLNLTAAEIAAVYDLTQTPAERRVIRKVMALVGSDTDAQEE
jgi:hypothetical protein